MSRTHIPPNFKQQSFFSPFSGYIGPFYLPEDYMKREDTVVAAKLVEHHRGSPGIGHGGLTLTLLDECMGRAASRAYGSICVTVSLTTNFVSSTLIDDFIITSATVSRMGKKIAFVDAQLHAGDKLLATATGTWANTGRPIPTPK